MTTAWLIAERPSGYSGRGREQPIPEKLLQRLWRQRAARQEGFRSAAGLFIRVVYPGREGTAAGPDFRDAIIEVEGQGLVRGDVELHVRQRDWSSHGHTQDPLYNGVVLHAALEVESASTGLHSGGQAPVVSLASLLDEALDEAAHPEAAAGPDDLAGVSYNLWRLLEPFGYSCPVSEAQAGELLDRAGDERFRARVREFAGLLQEAGEYGAPRAIGPDAHTRNGQARNYQAATDQVLYEGLMEGLGYKANRQGFLSLAHRVPWARLVELTANMDAEQAFLAVRGWLSQVSGLDRKPARAGALAIDLTADTTPNSTPAAAGAAGGQNAKLPPGIGPRLAPGDWRLSGLRPVNHPLRRMAGAAGLVVRFRSAGLTEGLKKICDGQDSRRLTQALMQQAEPAQPGAYVGQDRARDLAVNVVLPFLQALSGQQGSDPASGQSNGGDGQAAFNGRSRGQDAIPYPEPRVEPYPATPAEPHTDPRVEPSEEPRAEPYLELYRAYGKLQDNEVTREMASLLLPPAWQGTANSARRQQGLLRLHRLLAGES